MAKTTAMVTVLLLLLLLSHHPCYSTAASPIKTVVVLVMENRSFDHMLGWMKKLNPEINGVDGSESNLLNTTDAKSPRVFFGNQSHFVDPDPGHSFQAIREQIFGSNETSTKPPSMNGFAQQANSMDPNMPQSVMNGFQPDKVKFFLVILVLTGPVKWTLLKFNWLFESVTICLDLMFYSKKIISRNYLNMWDAVNNS